MAEHYVGEIRLFAGDFAPREWALCDGRSMPIDQFEVLFNLIGTIYGGDGQRNFNLPDLQGRVPVHRGQGPGIGRKYALGEKAGAELVWLNEEGMPAHTHAFQASKGAGGGSSPENAVIGSPAAVKLFKREEPETKLPPAMVGTVGGGQPHGNRMPFLAVTYIIALNGIWPPRG